MRFVVSLLLACSWAAAQQSPCESFLHRGKYGEATVCFTKLTRSPNEAARAEGLWGLQQFKPATEQFILAVSKSPKNAALRYRFGLMFLDHYQPGDATKLFEEALEIEPNFAPAFYGIALAASENYEAKAVELAQKALAADPKFLPAQELLAKLALEDNNPAKAATEAQKALDMSAEALDAMAVLASIDLLQNKGTSRWFEKIAAVNPNYGEAYATAGHFFVINRRYEEGIAMYRKALELHPELNEARTQLGVNLMRLGQEKDAYTQLKESYNRGYKSALTVNSLQLIDSYKNFVTFTTSRSVVRLDKKEAELLRPYVEGELLRAIETYDKKYKMKLDQPVQVEVYPNHEDFAVRTLGMPGLGALGVTFGTYVAMDSPSGRKPGSFHWASTLWHELSHVYVLTATKHRVPRWFTEGLAVYEETAAAPDWGDRLDPEAIKAIQNKKLLPIAELDRGFVRPSYPSQVVVSYFQAGRICQYIADKWGYDKLLDMMHSFGTSMSTPDVVVKHLGMKPEEFDTQFLAWLDKQTETTVKNIAEWRKGMKSLAEAVKDDKTDEVIAQGTKLSKLYPEYVEADSTYELVAEAYLKKDNKAAAIAELQQYSSIGGRNPVLLMKLAKLQEEAGKKQEATSTLERILFIYPQIEELHQRLGDLYMATDKISPAIREYNAVLASKPLDQAASRLRLAQALHTAKRDEEAKDQLLIALEAAPGFKPAQKLLLELSR